MKSYEELEQENEELRAMVDNLNVQLVKALTQIAQDHVESIQLKREFHQRAFQRICPIPNEIDELTVKFK